MSETGSSWKRGLVMMFIFITLFSVGFLIGHRHGQKCRIPGVEEKTDTLTIVDTISYYKPIPTDSHKLDIRIPVLPHLIMMPGDSVCIRDTIYLPRESRTYQDTTFKAVVSGYDPTLDFIEVYPRTEIITRDRTVEVKKKPHWSFGLQAGYGMTMSDGKVIGRPYVGAGITWILVSW